MIKCALVVGHKLYSQGAKTSTGLQSEFFFNNRLAWNVYWEILKKISGQEEKLELIIVYRKTYRSLPDDINKYKPDFLISLHCNAYSPVNHERSMGTEILYYHKSIEGKKIAGILYQYLMVALELPGRGLKPKSSEDRGGYLLRYTEAPCIISEPFFIDNDSDFKQALLNYPDLVKAYANAIIEITERMNYDKWTKKEYE